MSTAAPNDPAPVETSPAAPQGGFFGHPKGLRTLFFTEMWERFSFYGMRAILLLFMTASIASGGLGFPPSQAGPIYALYTSMVYLSTVPGGWLADNFLGARKSVFWGGVLIMIGHILLALHGLAFFYGGLAFVVLGTGLLKPCISAIVGDLYEEGDARRDAGFSIFYMGINIGAWAAPLVCGWLAESEQFREMLEGWGMDPKNSWHWGFGAAAVGMFFGLVQYILTSRDLGDAGLNPAPVRDAEDAKKRKRTLLLGLGAVALLGAAAVGYQQTAKALDGPTWSVGSETMYKVAGVTTDGELDFEAGEEVDGKTIRVSLGDDVWAAVEAADGAAGELAGLDRTAAGKTITAIRWTAEEKPRYTIAGTAAGEPATYADGLEPDAFEKEVGADAFVAIQAAIAAGETSGAIEGKDFSVGGLDQEVIKNAYTVLMLIIVIGLFGSLLFRGEWTRNERARLVTIFVLFLGAATFWGVFEQAGSTLSLFAKRNTATTFLGFDFPASWFQSANALFIVTLAPVFAWMWIKLGKKAPSDPAKFAVGLFFAGAGFLVLAGGASGSGGWVRVSPMWLIAVYLLHTIGELFLSPVGLSSMTKLAPARVASLMMGVWFLAASVGNFIAGSAAGFYEDLALPALFRYVALGAGIMAFVMFLLVGPIRKMLAESESETEPSA
ncbi:MAG: oligopeptide:H+ symporter [Planctomycetota bacterium]